jgi:hypothetical protein
MSWVRVIGSINNPTLAWLPPAAVSFDFRFNSDRQVEG